MKDVRREMLAKGEGAVRGANAEWRKSGKAPISVELKNEICRAACTVKPENATHWSTRSLAKHCKVSHGAVSRILRERDIKPHSVKRFGCGNDPQFAEKLTDAAGLYMNPPDNAIVLCADGKRRIQALERAQHTIFPQANLPAHQSHDYYRHGTTTLFTALDYLTGNVIGDCKDRHTSEDYLKFIKKPDKECEDGKILHIIADNYATHKTAEVKAYIKSKGGRFETHFIPTHSSWLNLVERFFRKIATEKIRRESRHSVNGLITAIRDYIKTWNKSKRKFYWSKSGDDILQKINKHKSGVSQT